MRAAYEVVQLPEKSSLKCWRSWGQHFNPRWHFHPEMELLYIEHSRGLRIVGDSVSPFHQGDLVLIGSNLPHVLHTSAPSKPRHDHARSIIAQFRDDFIGRPLADVPEFSHLSAMFQRSKQGIHFRPSVARAAAVQMRRLCQATGTQRVLQLLQLLDFLARSRGQILLSSAGYVPKLKQADAARINAVCRYVQDHLTVEIAQPAAAALARMTTPSFSRFFRQKMGCTFSAYVNQVRMTRAVHLMVEDNMTISEACFASGFNNLSNFNRRFRSIKGTNPSSFLRQFNASGANEFEHSREYFSMNRRTRKGTTLHR